MSQNDILLLNLKTFEVVHKDCEAGIKTAYFRKKYKTLEEALIECKKLQDKNSPEFGIYIV
jgi:hypothetical protein